MISLSRNLARVADAGCPNAFFLPAEISATVGCITFRSTLELLEALPWWAALSTVISGRRFASCYSTVVVTSPVKSIENWP